MGFGGGDSEIGLLFRILADSSQAAAELAKFRATAARDVDGVLAEFRKSNAYKADFKSTTDVLIAESQRAIANAEKTALSASHALQTTASAITTAQKEASGLANSFISTYGNALLMTGGIVGAGAALIGLAKYATDAAAELWDAHQKTGFLVESLSALKNLGDTAGVSFQSTSTALGLFEKNMGAAHNATSKQSALFKSLNIDIDDHEKALRQAFVALFNMKEGEEQTSAAMQLFGRSGKEMIGIIQESNGNLDNAMAKFKALGTLISTEDARAADQFQDALKGAGQQALALAKDIGTSLIPVFQVLLGVINSVIVAVRALVVALQWLMSFSSPALEKLKELQDRANFKMPLIPKMPTLPGTQHFLDEVPVQSDISGGAEEGNKTSMDTLHKMMQESAKAASEAKRQEAERLQGLKEASSARLEVLQIEERAAGRIRQEQLEEAERAYKKGEISLKQYTTRITNIEGAYLQTRKENIQKERDELKAQYDNAEQIKVKGLALDEKVKIAQIEHDKNLKTYKAKADQQEEERQKRHLEAEEERQKISDDARIAQFKDNAEQRKITYKAAEDAIVAIQARSLERQGLAALEARNKEKEGTAEYERLNDIYLAIQAKAAAFKEEVERRKREALKKTLELETVATTKAQIEARGGKGAQPGVGGETVGDFTQTHTHGGDVTPKTTGEVAGLQTNMDAFQAWGDKINEIFGLTGENAKVFGQILSQTFGQVANAVGNAVDAFVKFGTVQGGFKKFAVDMIASIAQMSIVQAVFELAQGLAMTALAYFTGNAKFAESATFHYASAAAFGVIGGIAAVAGRGLAAATGYGNDQQQKAAVSSGAGGGGAGGTSSTSSGPAVIDVGRTRAASDSHQLAQAASDLRAAADDHLKAASIFNAAANRIYGQTASEVVRAGIQQSPHLVPESLRDDFRRNGITRHMIRTGEAI